MRKIYRYFVHFVFTVEGKSEKYEGSTVTKYKRPINSQSDIERLQLHYKEVVGKSEGVKVRGVLIRDFKLL